MRVLVTGGAGFVGANVAARLLASGEEVVILDNLSRQGVEKNLTWLTNDYGKNLEVVAGDVRDRDVVRRVVAGADHVFHFAAQVAVTTSITDPSLDFEVNAAGTLNVLEAARRQSTPPSLVYSSTNKVYGALEDVELEAQASRYVPRDRRVAERGISEARSLSFHSPYGCSKGTADQYVLDYAKTFGLRAVVFRMSCIYGPRQLGTEDQGWVAHFLIRALRGEPITVYGDGKQVRDVLFVEDLVDAFTRVRSDVDRLSGRAFNVGGGPKNSISLLELVEEIERRTRRRPRVTFAEWRRADQRYYVSDPGALGEATGWEPRVSTSEGLSRLLDWLVQQPDSRARGGSPASATP